MQHTPGLTRLLYDKHAVELALIDSIIINPPMPGMRPHPAYFWAYELYYSGFTAELINLFWAIYYDFYVVSNIEFEIYLEEYLEYDYFISTPKAVGIIIRNMLNLTPTFDVYLAVRGWAFTNHAPDLAHVLSCAAFLPIDQAIAAVATFVNVAENEIAGFTDAVKYGPHSQKVGVRRRLFAACFMYEQSDSDEEGDIFIKSYKHALMYDFDFTLVPASKLLTTYRKYDLRDHVFIKDLDDGAACGVGPDWINQSIHTPFWSEKIRTAGGRIQYNEIVWPSNKASNCFITTWGGIDPEDCQQNANSAHFYVNTEKEYRASLLKLISAAGANAFMSDIETAAAATTTKSIERIKRPALQFTPIQTSPTVAGGDNSAADLSATIANILGETHKDEFGWYMQILSRYELTPESFAGVKYKGLKRFVKNQLTLKETV